MFEILASWRDIAIIVIMTTIVILVALFSFDTFIKKDSMCEHCCGNSRS